VEFRAKCKEKWPELFDDHIVEQGEVVFGVAEDKANSPEFPLNMTYFAKLNLYNAVFSLKQLDFTVKLAPVTVK